MNIDIGRVQPSHVCFRQISEAAVERAHTSGDEHVVKLMMLPAGGES
jgi:hypothetical protein